MDPSHASTNKSANSRLIYEPLAGSTMIEVKSQSADCERSDKSDIALRASPYRFTA